MRYFFDTEFLEDGRTIDLISIGIVAEDGREFYAEVMLPMRDVQQRHDPPLGDLGLWLRIQAHPWLMENVVPHLRQAKDIMSAGNTREEIANSILWFVGDDKKPEFWAYYADYDWVVLCQLYGTMMDLPEGWPMFCMDLKQLHVEQGSPTVGMPEKRSVQHDALEDARWNVDFWKALTTI